MKTSIFTTLLILITFNFQAIKAQPSDDLFYACNDFQFQVPIFANTNVETGIQYGENTTIGGNFQELLMDIYTPENDTTSFRPGIIFAHAGSFNGGSRADLQPLCEYYATLGYTAISIDIRPFDLPLDDQINEDQILDWLIKGVADMKAAIRFMKAQRFNGNPYQTSSNYLFPAGLGAGALVANHTAFLDESDEISSQLLNIIDQNGGWEGNSNSELDFDSSVYGVISFSGAVIDVNWIDLDDPVFFAHHDELDPIMPSGDGSFKAGDEEIPILDVQGTVLMGNRADLAGLHHSINIESGSAEHLSILNNGEVSTELVDQSGTFLQELFCTQILSNDAIWSNFYEISLFPNPANDFINLQIDENLKIRELVLLDCTGNQIKVDFDPGQNMIDVSNLNSGVYFLRLNFDRSEKYELVKFFKQ